MTWVKYYSAKFKKVVGLIKARGVMFDLDCTLVDTLDRYFELFNAMLAERGRRTLNRDEFWRVYVADELDDLISPPGSHDRERELHSFWMEFLRRYRENPRAKLIPGVTELMKGLHSRGVPVAVMTSCIVPVEKLRRELDDLGIGRYVRAIATAHDVVRQLERGHHFSKKEIMALAAERLRMSPSDLVVVGDYWNDIRDGKAIGAKTVAVLTGGMRRELLERYGPDAIVGSVSELPDVVEFSVI
ncbi:MAG: HAD family hydrolase [Candidatus Hadarchaeales archaeon]